MRRTWGVAALVALVVAATFVPAAHGARKKGGDVHEPAGHHQAAVVVHAGFRNDEAGMAGTDPPARERDGRLEHVLSSMIRLTR